MIEEISKNKKSIRELNSYELNKLCRELRTSMIMTTSQNGGHLASSLGCVELTVALMRVFDFPYDKVVWDVGHQAYAYKLLTDRFDRFNTLRKENGISGFSHEDESPYESFISGHASTSLAVAFGLKTAMLQNNDNHYVVAVIGDGSLTGGMAFEGINNIGKSDKNIIVILNDNEMAISENQGAVSEYLSKIRSKTKYYDLKEKVKDNVSSIPFIGETISDTLSKSKSILKRVVYSDNIFENFGLRYFGPVNGHDIDALTNVLNAAKTFNGPCVVHIKTIKGMGYKPAMENPGAFHGVGKFNPITGEIPKSNGETFSSVFGKELVNLAKKDKDIIAITAAMEDGTGLSEFSSLYKNEDRFFDVGIAEEFGLTFASALSAKGKKAVFAVYSTFLQRCYDQIIHDASIENRHLILAIDRSGIVGSDGETHQGLFDAAFLSTIPNMTVFSPSNFNELKAMLKEAIYDVNGPVAIRYPRGKENPVLADFDYNFKDFDIYGNINSNTLLITYGREYAECVKACDFTNKSFAVLKLNKIIPIEIDALKFASNFENIIFIEEGIKFGGIGMNFMSKLMEHGYKGKVKIKAITKTVPQAEIDSSLKKLGLDCDSILKLL